MADYSTPTSALQNKDTRTPWSGRAAAIPRASAWRDGNGDGKGLNVGPKGSEETQKDCRAPNALGDRTRRQKGEARRESKRWKCVEAEQKSSLVPKRLCDAKARPRSN